MSSISIDAPLKEDVRERPTDNALYRAIWRWHFYADTKMTVQDRAYTSPIWYTPET
jgi:hypothetical protein